MIDEPTTRPSDEFRALTILALALAETLGQQGQGEKFLVNLMRVIEDQRPTAPDGDRAIIWADKLSNELLIR
ncbi:hypothetical protein OVA11_19160 [Caulobacter sp. SL161]|uniref:hypothetical protein n=1 Tax=Caulobacter sp. SL161 TaxID=2995156 RepID=UPI002276FD59|nr:hypothetical protein [Caulobacter sp. SL161]MCY1649098.1 hypothetical protein [Caulobacter sp. SL161]